MRINLCIGVEMDDEEAYYRPYIICMDDDVYCVCYDESHLRREICWYIEYNIKKNYTIEFEDCLRDDYYAERW